MGCFAHAQSAFRNPHFRTVQPTVNLICDRNRNQESAHRQSATRNPTFQKEFIRHHRAQFLNRHAAEHLVANPLAESVGKLRGGGIV